MSDEEAIPKKKMGRRSMTGRPGYDLIVPVRDRSVNRTSQIPCVEGKAHHWQLDDEQKGKCLNCLRDHQFLHDDVYGGTWDRTTSEGVLVKVFRFGRDPYSSLSDETREAS